MLSIVIIVFVIRKFFGESINSDFLLHYNSITILGAAISLLLAFEHISFRRLFIKGIAFFSPLCFSVYLIHDQKLIQERIIGDSFSWIAKLPAYQMIPFLIGTVIGMFLICSLIDLTRCYLFKVLRIKERLGKIEIKIKNCF